MTVGELIQKLQKYENKDLKVLITVGNEDNDTISTGDFELFNTDEEYEYMEIYIDEKNCKTQL